MRRVLALLLLAAAPAQAGPACPAPIAVADESGPLPRLAASLRPGATLDILVVGSATVFGAAASALAGQAAGRSEGATDPGHAPPAKASLPPQDSFPVAMQTALQLAVPGLRVRLTVRGGRGLTASAMLDLLRDALPRHAYQLVLWQTGTVDAVRDIPPGDFYQTLSDGVALAQTRGADVVLVDPQYSRFLDGNANLDPYEDAMQTMAALPGVVLFHRFDRMEQWAETGVLDLERAAPGDRQAVAHQVHYCLGQALAARLLLERRALP